MLKSSTESSDTDQVEPITIPSIPVKGLKFCCYCGCKFVSKQKCDCSLHLNNTIGARVVPMYVITPETKQYVLPKLLCMTPELGSQSEVYNVRQNSRLCIDRIQFLQPKSPIVAALCAEINAAFNYAEYKDCTYVHGFIKRPYSLSATAMSSRDIFENTFSSIAIEQDMQTVNTKSKFCDLILGEHFKNLYTDPETYELQMTCAIPLSKKLSIPVYAKPDAIWRFDDEEYVVEFKTVEKLSSVNVSFEDKLKKWVKQVGCTQLEPYDSSQSRGGAPKRKHLLVLMCWNDYNIIVIEVKPENVAYCVREWKDWFKHRRQYEVKLLSDYFNGTKKFHQVYAEVAEMKLQIAQEEAAEKEWVTVPIRSKMLHTFM